MKKHLFLTGEIQCGKSTLIQAVLHHGAGKLVVAGGFLSYFLQADAGEVRTLYLGDAGIYAQLFAKNTQPFRPVAPQQIHQALLEQKNPPAIAAQFWEDGHRQVVLETFERNAKEYIQNGLRNAVYLSKNQQAKPILVLDECGYLESRADCFQQSVQQALAQSYPILGVVRQMGQSSWLDMIYRHPQVEVITVCRENREQLVKRLVHQLLSKNISSKNAKG